MIKKHKKPKFIRENSFRKVRVTKGKKIARWRKPRGEDSKQARREKSRGAVPKVGYGRERKLRNLHPCGLPEKLVYNVNDLEKGYAIRIASSVGKKKREEIIATAKKMDLKVLNE
ncbi:MAG: eL32 family ribosomal protein [archaeon]